jgi:hypothetical protein
MVKRTSFEGTRIAVSLDSQTYRAARKQAGLNALEPVLRQWIYNWRSLGNLSPFLYERLVYAASERQRDLTAMVNEALTTFCSKLAALPEGVGVVTPVTVMDDSGPSATEPQGRTASFASHHELPRRAAVKVDTQTYRAARWVAGPSAVEPVVRQWIYNWRTLANLSPFLYERLVHAAQERRVDLAAMVNEALTTFCSELPEVPEGVGVVTPMTVVHAGEAPTPQRDGSTKGVPTRKAG